MYQLIQMLTINDLFKRQLPLFMTSFFIAEMFYKFHSFTLECAAFLVTWFVLDVGVQLVLPAKKARIESDS